MGTTDTPAGVQAPEQTEAGQAQGQDTGISRSELTGLLAEFKNGLFADVRRAGLLNKGKEEPQKPNQQASGNEASMDPSEVQSLIARERSFTRAVADKKLGDKALARLERAFQAEKPDDVAAWVGEYLGDFGIGTPENGDSSSPNPDANNMAPENTRSVTDVAAPAGTAPSDIRDPYSLTEDDVADMVRRHGTHGAGKKLMEAIRKAPSKRLGVRK